MDVKAFEDLARDHQTLVNEYQQFKASYQALKEKSDEEYSTLSVSYGGLAERLQELHQQYVELKTVFEAQSMELDAAKQLLGTDVDSGRSTRVENTLQAQYDDQHLKLEELLRSYVILADKYKTLAHDQELKQTKCNTELQEKYDVLTVKHGEIQQKFDDVSDMHRAKLRELHASQATVDTLKEMIVRLEEEAQTAADTPPPLPVQTDETQERLEAALAEIAEMQKNAEEARTLEQKFASLSTTHKNLLKNTTALQEKYQLVVDSSRTASRLVEERQKSTDRQARVDAITREMREMDIMVVALKEDAASAKFELDLLRARCLERLAELYTLAANLGSPLSFDHDDTDALTTRQLFEEYDRQVHKFLSKLASAQEFTLGSEHDRLREEHSDLRDLHAVKIRQTKEAYDARDLARAELDECRQALDAANTQIKKKDGEMDELRGLNDKISQMLQMAEEQVKHVEARVSDREGDVASGKRQRQQVESERDRALAEIEDLQAQFKRLNSDLQEKHKECDSLKARLAGVEAEENTLLELRALRKQYAGVSRVKELAIAECSELKETAQGLRAERGELRDRARQLTAKMWEKEETIKRLSAELDSVRKSSAGGAVAEHSNQGERSAAFIVLQENNKMLEDEAVALLRENEQLRQHDDLSSAVLTFLKLSEFRKAVLSSPSLEPLLREVEDIANSNSPYAQHFQLLLREWEHIS